MFDIVTVVHNYINTELAHNRLKPSLDKYSNYPYEFIVHDNSINNIGFARACNEASKRGTAPIIGFLNPDAFADDYFMDLVLNTLVDDVVITGCHYGKNPVEIHGWGLKNWVCGASMFVRRDWFEFMGGFDEQFVWSHEETDFIRMTEQHGKICRAYSEEEFRIVHSSPSTDSPEDQQYKTAHFAEAARRYHAKWA